MLLIESCLWYELIPGQRGRDLFDVYKDNLNNIPTGDIVGVAGDNLPTYLLSSNSQIMKLRKRRKVMKTPSFTYLSREFKISQVFLFYPLKPNAHIDFNRIGNIWGEIVTLPFITLDNYFYTRSGPEERDKDGRLLTLIEKNER